MKHKYTLSVLYDQECPLFNIFEDLEPLSEFHENILKADWGISSEQIKALPSGDMKIAKVVIDQNRFQFDEQGQWAYIIVADLMAKDAMDLVAISCSRPTRFGSLHGWHWCGAFEVMRRLYSGWPEIYPRNVRLDCGYTNEPLLLNWHPLEMIAFGCIGAVPLSQCAIIDLRSIREGIPLVFCEQIFLNTFMKRYRDKWPHEAPEIRLLKRRAA